MARKSPNGSNRPVDNESVARAFAKAVADGDIVNFRILFMPWSPAREGTTESFDDAKYSYLSPAAGEESPAFRDALQRVKDSANWSHIQGELAAKRPAQLPSALLLALADNAVRLGKFTAAAQAYELLRVRRRIQYLFYDRAAAAIEANRAEEAARALRIGVGLAYDYAAFPEPLPAVGRYQARALVLHAVYPASPEQGVALLPDEQQVQAALEYLLQDNEATARLRQLSLEKKADLVAGFVRLIDPAWDEFRAHFEDTCALIDRFRQRMRDDARAETLAEQIEEQQGGDPYEVMVTLLGREISGGEWWRYLRELAYLHPAAALFVGRQRVGDTEVIMPRLRTNSILAVKLGLSGAPQAVTAG